MWAGVDRGSSKEGQHEEEGGGKGRFEILGKGNQDLDEKRGEFTKSLGKTDLVNV